MFYILYVNQTLSLLFTFYVLFTFYFPILLPVITVWINLNIIYITLLFSINFSTFISLHLTTYSLFHINVSILKFWVKWISVYQLFHNFPNSHQTSLSFLHFSSLKAPLLIHPWIK